MTARATVQETARALLEPRRLLPILVVCVPMVAIQRAYSHDPLAVPLAIATCVAFVVVGPFSWRILFPDGKDSALALRLLAYALVGGAVVSFLGVLIPHWTGMGRTFLTTRHTLLVTLALFWVGGWGLGRDIGLEASLRREQARTRELAQAAEQAQLLALRSHLDPHFLFNTLNAIAEWCREDGEIAERAVLQLSQMLRTVLAGVRSPHWALSQELELVRTLFALHLLRDPGLFQLTMECPEALGGLPVPPLLLLPLAENAIKHGPAAGHRGNVRLSIEPREDGALMTLENPGPYRGPRPGSEGLPTVQRRLELAYGREGLLRIAGVGDRTVVEVTLLHGGPRPEVLT
jgi:hypothetical protein